MRQRRHAISGARIHARSRRCGEQRTSRAMRVAFEPRPGTDQLSVLGRHAASDSRAARVCAAALAHGNAGGDLQANGMKTSGRGGAGHCAASSPATQMPSYRTSGSSCDSVTVTGASTLAASKLRSPARSDERGHCFAAPSTRQATARAPNIRPAACASDSRSAARRCAAGACRASRAGATPRAAAATTPRVSRSSPPSAAIAGRSGAASPALRRAVRARETRRVPSALKSSFRPTRKLASIGAPAKHVSCRETAGATSARLRRSAAGP